MNRPNELLENYKELHGMMVELSNLVAIAPHHQEISSRLQDIEDLQDRISQYWIDEQQNDSLHFSSAEKEQFFTLISSIQALNLQLSKRARANMAALTAERTNLQNGIRSCRRYVSGQADTPGRLVRVSS